MKELIKFLAKNPVGFLATIDDSHPRVRPFGFQFFDSGKFYFITSSTKEVYRHLLKVPFAEFSCVSATWTSARVKGQVCFCNDIPKKEKPLRTAPSHGKNTNTLKTRNLNYFIYTMAKPPSSIYLITNQKYSHSVQNFENKRFSHHPAPNSPRVQSTTAGKTIKTKKLRQNNMRSPRHIILDLL